MADTVAIVCDLIFSTRVVGTARALGIEIQTLTTPEALAKALTGGGVRLVTPPADASATASRIGQTLNRTDAADRFRHFCSPFEACLHPVVRRVQRHVSIVAAIGRSVQPKRQCHRRGCGRW